MTGTLLNYMIDKYLSNILEIDKDKTKTSLFSGTVEMENLRVKPSMFEEINLPYIEVAQGFIGKINITFSPLTFWKNPIKIKVSKVFIYLRQKSVSKLKESEEIKKMEDYKWKKLVAWEELQNQIGDVTYEPGTTEQIINNTSIEIEDVVIRFEDTISYPVYPFAFGFVIQKVIIKSTDFTFNENLDKVKAEEINFKIVKTQNLNFYLDYSMNFNDISVNSANLNDPEISSKALSQMKDILKSQDSLDFYAFCCSEIQRNCFNQDKHAFFLWNFNSLIKLTMNAAPKQNFKEKIIMEIEVPEVNSSLNTRQITVLLKLASYASMNNFYTLGIQKKYYVNSVSSEFSESYISKYMNYYKAKYDKKYLNKNDVVKLEPQIKIMENGFTFTQVSSLREIAIMKYSMAERLKEIDSQEQGYAARWRVTSYFTSNSDKNALNDLASKKESLKKEEADNLVKIQELMKKQELQYQEEVANEYSEFPRNYVFFVFVFKVDKYKMALKKDYASLSRENLNSSTLFNNKNNQSNQDLNNENAPQQQKIQFKTKTLAEFNIEEILLKLNLGGKVAFKEVHFSVSKLNLTESILETNNSSFSHIISTIDISDDNSKEINAMEDTVKALNIIQDKDIAFNKMLFDKRKVLDANVLINPEDPVSDYRVDVKSTNQLMFTVNKYSIFYIKDKFLSALQSEVDLSEVGKYAKSEITKLIKKGKQIASNKMKDNTDKRLTLLLNMILVAPLIIVPQDIMNTSNMRTLNASIGLMHMYSNIVDKESTKKYLARDPKVDYLASSSSSSVEREGDGITGTVKDSGVKGSSVNNIVGDNSKSIYDEYKFSLKGLSISTSNDFDPSKVSLITTTDKEKDDASLKQSFLEPLNMEISLKSILDANDLFNDNILINMNLMSVRVMANDHQIKLLLDLMSFMGHNDWLLNRNLEREARIEKVVNQIIGILPGEQVQRLDDSQSNLEKPVLARKKSAPNDNNNNNNNNNEDETGVEALSRGNFLQGKDSKFQKSAIKLGFERTSSLTQEEESLQAQANDLLSSTNYDSSLVKQVTLEKNKLRVTLKVFKISFSLFQITMENADTHSKDDEFLFVIINLFELNLKQTVNYETNLRLGVFSTQVFDRKITKNNPANNHLECIFSSSKLNSKNLKDQIQENQSTSGLGIQELQGTSIMNNDSEKKFFLRLVLIQTLKQSKTDVKMTSITCVSMIDTIKRLSVFSNSVTMHYNNTCEEILITQFTIQENEAQVNNNNNNQGENLDASFISVNSILNQLKSTDKQASVTKMRKHNIEKLKRQISKLNTIKEEDNDENDNEGECEYRELETKDKADKNNVNRESQDGESKGKSIVSSKSRGITQNYMYKNIASKISQRKAEEKDCGKSRASTKKSKYGVIGKSGMDFINNFLNNSQFFKKVDRQVNSQVSLQINHIDFILPLNISSNKQTTQSTSKDNENAKNAEDSFNNNTNNNQQPKVSQFVENSLKSSYLHFCLSMCFKANSKQEYQESISKLTNRTEYIKYSKMDIMNRIFLSGMTLDILEFNEDSSQQLNKTKILETMKLAINISSSLNLAEETLGKAITFDIDPIKVKLGIKELVFFQHYSAKLSASLKEITSENTKVTHGETAEIIQHKKQLEALQLKKQQSQLSKNNNNNNNNNNDLEDDLEFFEAEEIDKKSRSQKAAMKVNSINKNNNASAFNEQQQLHNAHLAQREKAFKSKVVLTNISDLNYMTDVILFLNHFEFKLINDVYSKKHFSPIVKFDLNMLDLKFVSNTDPRDIDNLAIALVEMISKIKTNKSVYLGSAFENPYNIQTLAKFLNLTFNTQLSLKNDVNRDWEPLIEKIAFEVNLSQVLTRTRLNLGVNSNNEFNVNITPQMLGKLKKTGELFKRNSEGEYFTWGIINEIEHEEEEEEDDDYDEDVFDEKTKAGKSSSTKPESAFSNRETKELREDEHDDEAKDKDKDTKAEKKPRKEDKPYIEVQNYLGVDCEVYFDAATSKVFNLKEKDSIIFTKKQVKQFYKTCSEDALILHKHKLSVRFKLQSSAGTGSNGKKLNESFVSYNNNKLLRNNDNTLVNYENASVLKNSVTRDYQTLKDNIHEVFALDFSYNHMENFVTEQGATVNAKVFSGGQHNIKTLRLASNVKIENNTPNEIGFLLLEKRFIEKLKSRGSVYSNNNKEPRGLSGALGGTGGEVSQISQLQLQQRSALLRENKDGDSASVRSQNFGNIIFLLKEFSKYRFPLDKLQSEYELRVIPNEKLKSLSINTVNSFTSIKDLDEFPLMLGSLLEFSSKNKDFEQYINNKLTVNRSDIKGVLNEINNKKYLYSKVIKLKSTSESSNSKTNKEGSDAYFTSFDLLVLRPNSSQMSLKSNLGKSKTPTGDEENSVKNTHNNEQEDNSNANPSLSSSKIDNSNDFYFCLSINIPVLLVNKLPLKLDFQAFENPNCNSNQQQQQQKEDLQLLVEEKRLQTHSCSLETFSEEVVTAFNFIDNPLFKIKLEYFNKEIYSSKVCLLGSFNCKEHSQQQITKSGKNDQLLLDSEDLLTLISQNSSESNLYCSVYPETWLNTKSEEKAVFKCPFKINIKIEHFPPTSNYDLTSFDIIEYQTSARIISFYIDTIIVNKLNYPLTIKEKPSLPSSDKKEQQNESNSNNNNNKDVDYRIEALTTNFLSFDTENHEKKAKFKSDVTTWQDSLAAFLSLNSLGINGIISFIEKALPNSGKPSVIESGKSNNDNKDNPLSEEKEDKGSINNIIWKNASLIIKSSDILNLTTLIVLEPRFVLINKLSIGITLQVVIIENEDTSKAIFCEEQNLEPNSFLPLEFHFNLSRLSLKDREKEETRLSKLLVTNNPAITKKIRFKISAPGSSKDPKHSEGSKEPNTATTNKQLGSLENDLLFSSDFNLENLDETDFYMTLPESSFDSNKEAFTGLRLVDYNNQKKLLVNLDASTTDQGLITLQLRSPVNPQLRINNSTNSELLVRQGNTKESLLMQSNSSVDYAYTDLSLDEKFLELTLNSEKIKVSFNKLERVKCIKIMDKEYFVSISLENGNQTRVLKIEEEIEEDLNDIRLFFIKKTRNTQIRFSLHLQSFGFSLIDHQMNELLFISLHNIDLKLSSTSVKAPIAYEETYNLELYVKNFQIDYCMDDSFKILLHPKIQLIPEKEKEYIKDGMDIVPFLQILICRKTSSIYKTGVISLKYPQIDLIIQELCLKLDQFAINRLLNYSKNLSQTQVVDNNQGMNGETSNVNDITTTNVITPKATMINTIKKTATTSSSSNMPIIGPELEQELSTELFEVKRILTEESSAAKASKEVAQNYLLIEALMLSALKISITLRIDITSLDVSLLPKFAVTILGTVGNAIARITNAPLSFNELIIQDCFTTSNKLISTLVKYYSKSGITQFYKILGSSDLIGNPIGLIDKLGTGFVEFFNEPRKGFSQGPSAFGLGLAKGVRSLVSNVIGGGLDSVGKISGTLLNVSKDLRGEKHEVERDEDEPQNVAVGAYEGVKGGFSELGKGIAGIFTNPYKRAKAEGVGGFIKGLGIGILGAFLSPFTAILKIGNSLIVGMKNTVSFNKGKLTTFRYRHPRFLERNEALKNYSAEYAEVKAIIKNSGDMTYHKIIFFNDFVFVDSDYEKDTSTFIITDKSIIAVYQVKTQIFNIMLRNIVNIELHKIRKNYLVMIEMKNRDKHYVLTENLNFASQVYAVLEKIGVAKKTISN